MIHSKQNADIDQICKKNGVSLTEKRRNIFSILLSSTVPLSAYDIVDEYKTTFGKSMPAMSVYRILDFLSESGLVHKLDSTNQYLSCSHLQCDHEHPNAQFLICDTCSAAEEVALTHDLHDQIETGAEKTGFKLKTLKFELHGTCKACLSTQTS